MEENEKSKVMAVPNLTMPSELRLGMTDCPEYPDQLCFFIKNTGTAVWIDDIKSSIGEVVSEKKFHLTDEPALIRIIDAYSEEENLLKVDIYARDVNGKNYHYIVGHNNQNELDVLSGKRI